MTESHVNDIMMVCKMFPEFMRKSVIDKGKSIYAEMYSTYSKKHAARTKKKNGTKNYKTN